MAGQARTAGDTRADVRTRGSPCRSDGRSRPPPPHPTRRHRTPGSTGESPRRVRTAERSRARAAPAPSRIPSPARCGATAPATMAKSALRNAWLSSDRPRARPPTVRPPARRATTMKERRSNESRSCTRAGSRRDRSRIAVSLTVGTQRAKRPSRACAHAASRMLSKLPITPLRSRCVMLGRLWLTSILGDPEPF